MRDFGTLLRRLQRLSSVAILVAVIASTSFPTQGVELNMRQSHRNRVNRTARHRQFPGVSHAAGVSHVKIRGFASPNGTATLPQTEISAPAFVTCESFEFHTPENPRVSRTIRVVLPRPPPSVS